MDRRVFSVNAALAALLLWTAAMSVAAAPDRWWAPGEGRIFPASLDYENPGGALRTLLLDGPLPTKGYPFFEAIGSNGRACVTCDQPADGMSLSASSARALGHHWRQGPVVRGVSRFELSVASATRTLVALASARVRGDPDRTGVAPTRRVRKADSTGLHG